MQISTRDISIELIQAGIGIRERLSRTLSIKEWDEIFFFAKAHAIIGIVFSGIERIPAEQAPPEIILLQWIGQSLSQKRIKQKFDKILSEFADVLNSEEIPYVVFKGAAVASHYPKPAYRTMGDIDFYVLQSDYDRAAKLIETRTGIRITGSRVDKHDTFNWQGLRFEMHYQMETFGCEEHQKYFSRLMDDFIKRGVAQFVVDNTEVNMLPPMADLLLVFKHWMTHLIGEGIGLRQTTDLAVLIRVYQEHISVSDLKQHLRNIGYLRAFDALVALVEKYYRVFWLKYWDEEKSERKEKANMYADLLMKDVMCNGNFGRSDYKCKTGKMKRIETTIRFFQHCSRYFILAPKEIIYMIPKRISISFKAHRNSN